MRSKNSIAFDLKEIDAKTADIQHFLRHYRGRTIYISNDPINNSTFDVDVEIENIRNDLRLGNFQSAALRFQNLDEVKLQNYDLALVVLERIRWHLFQNKNYEALELCGQLLCKDLLIGIDLATVYQLQADLFLRCQDFLNAEQSASKAVLYSTGFPESWVRTSSMGFFAIALFHNGKADESQRILNSALKEIEKIKNNDIWIERILLILRTQIRINFLSNATLELKLLLRDAWNIARFIQNKHVQSLCEDDAERLGLNIGRDFKTESDWFWVESAAAVIGLHDQSIVRLGSRPIQAKLVSLLNRGVSEKEVLFENIWGMKFNKLLHDQVLRTQFHRIRNQLPAGFARALKILN